VSSPKLVPCHPAPPALAQPRSPIPGTTLNPSYPFLPVLPPTAPAQEVRRVLLSDNRYRTDSTDGEAAGFVAISPKLPA
jgi:hypothetical protein